MELVIATHNPGKLQEMRAGLLDPTVELVGIKELTKSTSEPVENGSSYEENALIKASYYNKQLHRPVIADDGGLELAAFPELLGLRTSRFFKGHTDQEKNAELLALYQDPTIDTRGELKATLVYFGAGEPLTVSHSLQGQIVPERGQLGYGFDRIFYLPELGKTLAELPQPQRNALSPRVQALNELIDKLKTRGGFDV